MASRVKIMFLSFPSEKSESLVTNWPVPNISFRLFPLKFEAQISHPLQNASLCLDKKRSAIRRVFLDSNNYKIFSANFLINTAHYA